MKELPFEAKGIADLWSKIQFEKVLTENELNLLEIKSKSMLFSSKEEICRIQTRIEGCKSFLDELKRLVDVIGQKLYDVASRFNNRECQIFIDYYFNGYTAKDIAGKYDLSLNTSYTYKANFERIVKIACKSLGLC